MPLFEPGALPEPQPDELTVLKRMVMAVMNEDNASTEILQNIGERIGREREKVGNGSRLDMALMKLAATVQRIKDSKLENFNALDERLKELKEAEE